MMTPIGSNLSTLSVGRMMVKVVMITITPIMSLLNPILKPT